MLFTFPAENVPFQIIMDNVDKRQKVRYMTIANQNKDHHWVNAYAVRNRVLAGKNIIIQCHVYSHVVMHACILLASIS